MTAQTPDETPDAPRPKVFCIGFHKTGTTSLNAALSALGYKVCSVVMIHHDDVARDVRAEARRRLDAYDAFEDNPWPILYQDLDQWAPGSKFILTLRPVEAWYQSALAHFGAEETPMRRWIYGVGAPAGAEAIYKARYERHNAEVAAYFRDRPNDLLTMRMPDDFNWPTLCAFLDQPTPTIPFPKKNSAAARQTAKPWWRFGF